MTNLRLLPPFGAFYNDVGDAALSGGKFYFYASGTSTPLDTYNNIDLGPSHKNTNPIVFDSAGRVATDIYVPLNTAYKIVLTDANDVTIRTADPVEVTGNSFDPEGSGLFVIVDGDLFPLLPPIISSSASITYANTDWGKATVRNNAGAQTDTLPAPSGTDFRDGWYADYINLGTSLVVTSAALINGNASLILAQSDFARIISNGTTYYAEVSNGGSIAARPGGSLTIASGIITIGAFAEYNIDTEGSAASDDLDTINGTSSGKLLFLRTTDDARDITIKHNTGNIYNPALQNIVLGKTQDIIFLRYDNSLSKWIVISYQNSSTKLPIFTSSYTSAPQIVTYTGALTLAHGLGVIPRLVETTWICGTGELGYTAGDRLEVPLMYDNGANMCGCMIVPDNTNLNVRYASTQVFGNKGTGVRAAVTAGNWTVEFRAYA